MKTTQLPIALIALVSALPERLDAQTINFDTFPDGSSVTSGTFITNQYASFNAIFSSTAPGGAKADPLFGEPASPPNFLYGQDPITLAGLYPIVIDFISPILGLDLTLISVGDSTVTATAYASDLTTILDTVSLSHPGTGVGFGAADPITLDGPSLPSISRVTIEITQLVSGDGFGIDDVSIHPVPEPSVAIFSVIGVIGLCFRRIRNKRIA